MGLKGICCEQLSWSAAQNTFPKQILPHNICGAVFPACGSCVHSDFCEAEGLDSHHLLSCFVSMLMLAIPRAVLVPAHLCEQTSVLIENLLSSWVEFSKNEPSFVLPLLVT